ncbi:YlxR family protein [Jonesia denitrificans]|uniref:YlxR family protein n=1 Tax=Jonesia denitrificans TaxID=43674 RepID=UPI00067455D9
MRTGHAHDTRIVVDMRRTTHGRGAWIHADAACVEHMLRKKSWMRAFRVSQGMDISELNTLRERITQTDTTLRYRNPHTATDNVVVDTSTGSG